jgi:4'-phosphopantetheinyl transferase
VSQPPSNDREQFELGEREVHVWYARPTAREKTELVAQWLPLLDDGEIRRQAAFINENARLEYLLTRKLVRTTLGRYLAADPKALRFQPSRYGRPELVEAGGGEHRLRFNVSHSGGLIACAIAWRREIGLDVESTQSSPVDEEVARRHFAAPEFENYRRQPTPAMRHMRFLEYWTLKESYLKARGTGLALPLDKFSCSWTRPDQVSLTIDPVLRDDADTWQLSLHRPAPEFIGAVAARIEKGQPVRIVERFAALE